MNTNRFQRMAIAVAGAALLPLSLTACSSDDSKDSDAAADNAASPSAPQESEPSADDTATMDKPFGPGCASVPADGAGSFDGMAKDPVATAASNNKDLSTLVTAVKKAGLVDTLNNAENITVFAPTNDAFAKIPKADLDKVLADKAMLTKVLTNHVVGEKLTPQQLEKGSFDTLAKTKLTTAGSGEEYKVNGNSTVVCGNVPTANATVYIVDTVLMPK
ncbi:fasciclin domain-containing protein [Streptomyces hypolithicus]